MNIKEIEELIKFVNKSGVSEVQIEDKDFKITIKTNPKSKESSGNGGSVSSAPAPMVAAPQVQAPATAPAPTPTAQEVKAASDESKYITIKSPMIGTFYRTPAPDKPSFVNVGEEIKTGKVICIIEAMKLFNEIEAEVSGKIVKVLVDNATPIEYDQPLFLVDPN